MVCRGVLQNKFIQNAAQCYTHPNVKCQLHTAQWTTPTAQSTLCAAHKPLHCTDSQMFLKFQKIFMFHIEILGDYRSPDVWLHLCQSRQCWWLMCQTCWPSAWSLAKHWIPKVAQSTSTSLLETFLSFLIQAGQPILRWTRRGRRWAILKPQGPKEVQNFCIWKLFRRSDNWPCLWKQAGILPKKEHLSVSRVF